MRMRTSRKNRHAPVRRSVVGGLLALTTLMTFLGGISAPTRPAWATVQLTGWTVEQTNGVSTAMPLVATDPDTRAAQDLPTHDPTVGTLAGQAGVDGGAASYSVSIAVPPGRAGMQPSLSLNYSSRGGNGVMGVGWSISGTSAIHRCPQTVEQDGRAMGVSYTSDTSSTTTGDRLCLDGQRLVLVSGAYYGAANAEYRTEIDSFARITQLGGDLGSGSASTTWFKVEQKSGQIFTYGSSAQSRAQPNGAAAALSWMVDKIQDRVGNYQSFTYTTPNSGEVLLSTVTYTGYCDASNVCTAGDRTVNFVYQTRAAAANAATDIGSSYLAGGVTMQTQALASITTKVGTTTVRTITPGYTASTVSGRLLLTRLTECARNSSGTMDCHPDTVFTNTDATPQFPFTSLAGAALPDTPPGTDTAPNDAINLHVVGDLDGDGTREAVAQAKKSDGLHTYMVQMTADRAVQHSVDLSGQLSQFPSSYADLDGDGRSEIIVPLPSGTSGNLSLRAWNLNRGDVPLDGTNPFKTVTTTVPTGGAQAADINADGRLDLVVTRPDASCTGDGVFVYLNGNSGAFGTSATFNPLNAPADTPLFCLVHTGSGTSEIREKIDHIADTNGDGLPDFVLVSSPPLATATKLRGVQRVQRSGATFTTTAISCTGLGFTSTPSTLGTDECNPGTTNVVQWLDVNADGLEDFVIGRPGSTWKVRLNRGGSATFDTAIDTGSSDGLQTSTSGLRYAGRLPAMDTDGDGKPELLVPASFALRLCTVIDVTPLPASGECPVANGIAPQSPSSGVLPQCAAYMCPERPDRDNLGQVEGDDLPLNSAQGQYRWKWNGQPVLGLYNEGQNAKDNSSYHLDRLRFKQTGASTITAVRESTALVARLGDSAAEDVFGDGLTDLVANVGCTALGIDTQMGPYTGCLLIGDDVRGPSTLPDGSAATNYETHYTAYANVNQGIATAAPRGGPAALSLLSPTPKSVTAAAPVQSPAILPDLLATATNGVGDLAIWGYLPLGFSIDPAGRDGVPLYSVPTTNGYADGRHFYFTSSMPVVAGFAQSNGIGGFLGFRSTLFGYSEAMYHTQGRGFQGFRTIVAETAPSLKPGDAGYNPTTDGPLWKRRVRTTTTYYQKFPLTGRVEKVETMSPETTKTLSLTTTTWKCGRDFRTDCQMGDALPTPTGSTVYWPFVDTQSAKNSDLITGTQYAHTDTSNTNGTASGWDAYGNLTNQTVTTADDGLTTTVKDLANYTVTTTNTYATADTGTWWLDKLTSSAVTKSISYTTNHPLPAGSTPARTVTTSFDWNTDRTPKTKTVAGGAGDPTVTTTTCYPTAGQPAGCPVVSGTSYGLPSRVIVTMPDLATIPALSPTRTTAFTYTKDGTSADPAGYFVRTVTADPAGINHTTTTTTAPRDGQPLTVTDPNLITTTNTYDAFGRLTKVETKDSGGATIGRATQSAWTRCTGGSCPGGVGEDGNEDWAAWRVTTVHAGAPTQVSWFDVVGRPIKQASGSFDESLVATLTDYDALGTVQYQSTPYKIGLTTPTFTSADYDALNRPTLKVLTGGSLDATNGNQLREYTYSGRTTTVIVHAASKVPTAGVCPGNSGNLCFVVSHRSNALGQLMRTTDAGSGITDYWTDANGKPAAMKDADGNVTSATYNALGQRTQSIDPDQGTWNATYDALGELLTQTDARSVVTTITARDALGRVTTQTLLPPTTAVTGLSPLVFQDSWSYDPANGKGLLGTATRRRGSDRTIFTNDPVVWQETTTYDGQSRPSTITSTTVENAITTTLGYGQTYDTWNRPDIKTYPSGLRVQNAYTAYGQSSALSNADTAANYWTANSADAWGHITGDSAANGVDGSYVFDADTGQNTSRSWTKSGASVTSVTYSLDSFENLKTQTRGSNTETYTYDTRQRLTSTSRTAGGVVSYAYTASGNIKYKDDYSTNTGAGTPAYGYGTNGCGPHGVSSVALNSANGGVTATFNCDANGNVIGGTNALTAGMFAADNKPISYTRAAWAGVPEPGCANTIADRLKCSGFEVYTPGTPAGTTTWSYASDGSKVYESSSRGATWFGHFGYEKNGSTQRHELGPVVVARTGGVDMLTTILVDRQGSTVATVDTATALRAFDAFGAVRNGDMTSKPDGKLNLPASIHGFTQHEHADDVKLVHMGGRVYDPALGRFLSVDPIIQNPTNSQSLNPYSYIGNNPLSGVDPSGYESEKNECAGNTTKCAGSYQPIQDPRSAFLGKVAAASAVSIGSNGSDNQGPTGAGSTPLNGAVADIASRARSVMTRVENAATNLVRNMFPENAAAADGNVAPSTASDNIIGFLAGMTTTAMRAVNDASALGGRIATNGLMSGAPIFDVSPLKPQYQKGAAVAEGVLFAATILGAPERMAAKGVGQTFERVVSSAELHATQKTGLLRGGREGENFFTNSASLDAKRAQQRLGLDGPLRDARIRFRITNDVEVTGPRSAAPGRTGTEGGGREFSTTGRTEIEILRVDPLRK